MTFFSVSRMNLPLSRNLTDLRRLLPEKLAVCKETVVWCLWWSETGSLVSNELIRLRLLPQKAYEADVSSASYRQSAYYLLSYYCSPLVIRSNEGLTLETLSSSENIIFVNFTVVIWALSIRLIPSFRVICPHNRAHRHVFAMSKIFWTICAEARMMWTAKSTPFQTFNVAFLLTFFD